MLHLLHIAVELLTMRRREQSGHPVRCPLCLCPLS